MAKLRDWRRERWLDTPGANDFVGPMAIIPDSILAHLSWKLHIPSTRECFDQVVQDWEQVKHDQHVSWYALSTLVRTPPTISNHPQLHPPTPQCHSDARCISLHNHTTPVARLNSDQCLISPNLIPMSWAATYLSFLHMPHLPAFA